MTDRLQVARDDPAGVFLRLKALKVGLDVAIERVQEVLDDYRATKRVKSFDTDLGGLTCAVTQDAVQISADSPHLLGWAEDNRPDAIEPAWEEHITVKHPARVKAETVKQLLSVAKIVTDTEIVDGAPVRVRYVIDQETGEPLPFARIVPGSRKWSPRLTDAAKIEAAEAVLDGLATITGLMGDPHGEIEP